MVTLSSRMTEKGQVTIPVEIRNALHIRPRDRVQFELVDGAVVMRPSRSRIADFRGFVAPSQLAVEEHELRERFEQGVADDVAESMRADPTDPS